MAAESQFGVYVHVPFCAHRCDYCAFVTYTDQDENIDAYFEALSAEIANSNLPSVTSVFFGGGTPSRVDPRHIAEVCKRLPLIDGAEVTVECNPDFVGQEHFEVYAAGGVNRLSFGVQSFAQHVLDSLGRTHKRENVERAVGLARLVHPFSINLDLIYGAAGESVEDWRYTLQAAMDLSVDHISAYALTVEGGTPLADEPERWPDDDDLAEKYLLANDILERHGLNNYEISNWARPGQECRHNLLYWSQGNYRGFGVAAHSHEDGKRWWNTTQLDRYLQKISAQQSVESSMELLTAEQRSFEQLQLAIRMKTGVPRRYFSDSLLEELTEFLEIENDMVRLNPNGRLMANELSLRMFAQ